MQAAADGFDVTALEAWLTDPGIDQRRRGLYGLLLGVAARAAGIEKIEAGDGKALTYVYEAQGEHRGVTRLIEELFRNNIRLRDIATIQSSLEDIFVNLVSDRKAGAQA